MVKNNIDYLDERDEQMYALGKRIGYRKGYAKGYKTGLGKRGI